MEVGRVGHVGVGRDRQWSVEVCERRGMATGTCTLMVESRSQTRVVEEVGVVCVEASSE